MSNTRIRAVVIPVYENEESDYLSVVRRRNREMTVLIYGWQGQNGAKMAGPSRLLNLGDQSHIPFLFTPAEQDAPKSVTHAAVSGFILHRDDKAYRGMRKWLLEHRVECFASSAEASPGMDAGTFYVVTGGIRLKPRAIPFTALTLSNHRRKLAPNKKRGYSWVWLPSELLPWYAKASNEWDSLAARSPLKRHAADL
jgi:hypothetical protein